MNDDVDLSHIPAARSIRLLGLPGRGTAHEYKRELKAFRGTFSVDVMHKRGKPFNTFQAMMHFQDLRDAIKARDYWHKRVHWDAEITAHFKLPNEPLRDRVPCPHGMGVGSLRISLRGEPGAEPVAPPCPQRLQKLLASYGDFFDFELQQVSPSEWFAYAEYYDSGKRLDAYRKLNEYVGRLDGFRLSAVLAYDKSTINFVNEVLDGTTKVPRAFLPAWAGQCIEQHLRNKRMAELASGSGAPAPPPAGITIPRLRPRPRSRSPPPPRRHSRTSSPPPPPSSRRDPRRRSRSPARSNARRDASPPPSSRARITSPRAQAPAPQPRELRDSAASLDRAPASSAPRAPAPAPGPPPAFAPPANLATLLAAASGAPPPPAPNPMQQLAAAMQMSGNPFWSPFAPQAGNSLADLLASFARGMQQQQNGVNGVQAAPGAAAAEASRPQSSDPRRRPAS
ncbi:hypothetical protein H9P43_002019 [Blastocladiella emersonii ATCC 22665]|nr:hypothetical protein H9P43_002019 [Blastocladiella emersonii ATCC 22665]